MGQPSVSVVLCVHNGERFLRATLATLVQQTHEELEIVVIDDGSTDATAQILSEYQGDARFRIFSQPNQGLVASLNSGLNKANGEFIARIDADDLAHPERLARQFAYLSNHPEVVALGSAVTLIDAFGRTRGVRRFPTGPSAVRTALSGGCALAHPAVMFRKSAVVSAGGYRAAFKHAEDYDLWLRLSETHELDNLPEALLCYRQHADSVTCRHAYRQSFATILAKLAHKRRTAGLPDPFDQQSLPVSGADLPKLSLSVQEEADLVIALCCLALTEEAGSVHALKATMEWGWSRRGRLHRGRYVRHAIVPYAAELLRSGQPREAFIWLTKGVGIAPFSALYAMAHRLIKKPFRRGY